MSLKRLEHRVALLILISLLTSAGCWKGVPVSDPVEYVYWQGDSVALRAYLFSPGETLPEPRGAVVVFHGGGWTIGEPTLEFPLAFHFAELGMTCVVAQYRLSDQMSITPLEAMADARAVIRWMRANADSLGIDGDRIAAYGWSAGGHLAASAAIFSETDSASQVSCIPNALVLESPALSLARDSLFGRLLLGRADPRSVSPDEHIRSGLPPTLVLQGSVDTITPLEGAERFFRRMVKAGNTCELKVYTGYGHRLIPKGPSSEGRVEPDPEVRADARKRTDAFLRSLEFF